MTIRLSTKLAKYLLGSSKGTPHVGSSLRRIMKDGFIELYPGTQPASADTAPPTASTPLVQIAANAGSPVQGRTGLEFATAAVDNVLSKAAGQTWSGEGKSVATSSGTTAGWFRFYHSGYKGGGSSDGATSVCFDGSIATSGADLNMSNTTIVDGATTTLDTFTVTLPLT